MKVVSWMLLDRGISEHMTLLIWVVEDHSLIYHVIIWHWLSSIHHRRTRIHDHLRASLILLLLLLSDYIFLHISETMEPIILTNLRIFVYVSSLWLMLRRLQRIAIELLICCLGYACADLWLFAAKGKKWIIFLILVDDNLLTDLSFTFLLTLCVLIELVIGLIVIVESTILVVHYYFRNLWITIYN